MKPHPLPTPPLQKARALSSEMLETATSSVAVMVLSWLAGILLARALGVAARGEYGAVQVWSQFLIANLTFSLFEAKVVKLRAHGINQENSVSLGIYLAIGLTFVLALLLVASYFFHFGLLRNFSPSIVVLFVILIIIGFFKRAFIATESAALSFRRLNIDRTLSPTLFLLGMTVLLMLGEASVFSALVVFVLSNTPILVLRFYRYRHHLFRKPDPKLMKSVLLLALRLHVSTASLEFSRQIDRLIITTLWSSAAVGNYFVAFSACGAGLSLVTKAIRATLLPTLAGADVKLRRARLEKLLRIALVLSCVLTVFIWLLAPWAIPLVYGADFTEAADFVRWMALAMLPLPLLTVVATANRANERGRPGIEMAAAAALVYLGGWLMTGFTEPHTLFLAMGISNLVALAAGTRHLVADSLLRIGPELMPTLADLRYLASIVKERTKRRQVEKAPELDD